VKERDSNLFHRDQWSDVRCSSAEFQFSKTKSNIIRLIVLFFFCLQSSAFWDFRWQKTMSFNDSENKKKIDRVLPGFGRVDRVPGRPSGSTGFPRVNSRAGFCLNPDRSQARVGQVPGRPAGPVRVLKHCLWCLSLGLGLVGV